MHAEAYDTGIGGGGGLIVASAGENTYLNRTRALSPRAKLAPYA